jgi:hypothetical protein
MQIYVDVGKHSPEYEREMPSVKYERQGKFAADTFTSEPTTA